MSSKNKSSFGITKRFSNFVQDILEKKLTFFVVIGIVIFLPMVLYSLWAYLPNRISLNGCSTFLIDYPFKGFAEAFLGGVAVAWAAYIWRVPIRRFFQPHVLCIRAPLMLGVAPLIVAKSKEVGLWEKHGLNVDLDFRYAGASALTDLINTNSHVQAVVASEVALCKFLGDNRQIRVRVMPFVRLEDHLKVLIRKDKNKAEYEKLSDLKGKNIGYFKDSVHDDFLFQQKIHNSTTGASLFPKKTVMDCYHSLIMKKDIEACVLWEPHYRAFTNMENICSVKNDSSVEYSWFLCVVALADYVESNEQIALRLLRAILQSVDYCKGSRHNDKIIQECGAFLHTEFTGIDKENLDELLKEEKHHFGVKENIEKYRNKLMDINKRGNEWADGAAELMMERSLWPELRWE
jgi:hypothetical protein